MVEDDNTRSSPLLTEPLIDVEVEMRPNQQHQHPNGSNTSSSAAKASSSPPTTAFSLMSNKSMTAKPDDLTLGEAFKLAKIELFPSSSSGIPTPKLKKRPLELVILIFITLFVPTLGALGVSKIMNNTFFYDESSNKNNNNINDHIDEYGTLGINWYLCFVVCIFVHGNCAMKDRWFYVKCVGRKNTFKAINLIRQVELCHLRKKNPNYYLEQLEEEYSDRIDIEWFRQHRQLHHDLRHQRQQPQQQPQQQSTTTMPSGTTV